MEFQLIFGQLLPTLNRAVVFCRRLNPLVFVEEGNGNETKQASKISFLVTLPFHNFFSIILDLFLFGLSVDVDWRS